MAPPEHPSSPLPTTRVGGELRTLLAQRDWSATPLGARETWSPTLTLAVDLILSTQFPMALRWGPEFVLLYNDGYRPILGDKHPSAFGLPFRVAWPEVQDQLGPLHEALLAGTREAFFSEDLPLRIQRYGALWETARFTVSYSPVPDPTTPTGIGGVLVTAVETTEKVRTADALRQLTENLETEVAERTRERDRIWRLTGDLLGVNDRNGTWIAINPAWTQALGWQEHEIIGTRVSDLRHPDDAAAASADRARLFQGEHIAPFVGRFRHKDGSYRWISFGAVAEDDLIYVVGRDITAEKESAAALRQAEEALRQSQKMEAVGQLTGGLAHDFNNLLTGIIGSLDMIQARVAQGRTADIDRYVRSAMTSANRAAALTHRLLAFARRQPIDPKPVNVNALITSMEDLLRRTIGSTIQMELVAAGGLWTTYCDPNQLENVLLNLAINARDAMPAGGRLTIETSNAHLDNTYVAKARDVEPGHYVCLSVSDSGTGMPPDVIARAFDPFFTTKPIGQGTGLGLSMVYGFARQSEGHVRIYSEVGHGTTVKLYLPRRHGATADEAAAPTAVAEDAGDGRTVLVVEDDAVVRELVVDILDHLGYRALEAPDGPAGLKILQSDERIDLLVSDIGLPGLNGRAVADAGRVKRPGLKVLFITGYAENAAITNGFLEPGMEMVTKPFAIDALAARIRDMIAG